MEGGGDILVIGGVCVLPTPRSVTEPGALFPGQAPMLGIRVVCAPVDASAGPTPTPSDSAGTATGAIGLQSQRSAGSWKWRKAGKKILDDHSKRENVKT